MKTRDISQILKIWGSCCTTPCNVVQISKGLQNGLTTVKFGVGAVNGYVEIAGQQAASTTVYCATAYELTGLTALYFNNCYVCDPSGTSKNEQLQQSLWELSEKMIERVMGEDAQ
uniref:Uncharacterized protein n=1 Tax=Anopheles culicifacies TaxID=139723 RepID=A0A182MHG6_9DIPT